VEKHFWKEKYISENWCFYMGTVFGFKVGIVLGDDNCIYLGKFVLGFGRN
jgi:hypothetical protein